MCKHPIKDIQLEFLVTDKNVIDQIHAYLGDHIWKFNNTDYKCTDCDARLSIDTMNRIKIS